MLRNQAKKDMNAASLVGVPLPFDPMKGDQFTSNLLHDESNNGRARFHRPDVWHIVQMGVAKAWIASSLHVVQSSIIPGRSLDARMHELSQHYIKYCKDFHRTKYINRLDKLIIGPGGNIEPTGCWNKAALSVTLMQWLQHLSFETLKEGFEADDKLRCIAFWAGMFSALFFVLEIG